MSDDGHQQVGGSIELDDIVDRVTAAIWFFAPAGTSREDLNQMARSAIYAMRRPTEAMRVAGFEARFDCDGDDDPTVVSWSAMIDAALDRT